MNAPAPTKRKLCLSPRTVSALGGLFLALSTSLYSAAQSAEPRPERRGPPPEAFSACESLVQENACSVKVPDGVIAGTCQVDRGRTKSLLCVPSDGPPPLGDHEARGGKDENRPRPKEKQPTSQTTEF